MGRKVLLGLDVWTIRLYTNRVMEALLSVKEIWLSWPNEARREETGQHMRAEGFPGCVGFVDFTNITLAEKPVTLTQSHIWISREVGMIIICDANERVIGFNADYPGRWASCYLYKQMDVHKQPDLFFSRGEYLLADMAYTVTTHCVSAYKPGPSRALDNKDFNTCVAKSNVRIENCIGALKARLGSLRHMTLPIQNENDLETLRNWITSCCILHNMLDRLKDPWDEVCLDDETPGCTGEKVLGSKEARDFRASLKRTTLETNRQRGALQNNPE